MGYAGNGACCCPVTGARMTALETARFRAGERHGAVRDAVRGRLLIPVALCRDSGYNPLVVPMRIVQPESRGVR